MPSAADRRAERRKSDTLYQTPFNSLSADGVVNFVEDLGVCFHTIDSRKVSIY